MMDNVNEDPSYRDADANHSNIYNRKRDDDVTYESNPAFGKKRNVPPPPLRNKSPNTPKPPPQKKRNEHQQPFDSIPQVDSNIDDIENCKTGDVSIFISDPSNASADNKPKKLTERLEKAQSLRSLSSTNAAHGDARMDKDKKSTDKRQETPSNDKSKSSTDQTKSTRQFSGKFGLQYATWAHYMSLSSAFICIFVGVFAGLWTTASTYHCKVDGVDIHSMYRLNTVHNNCSATYLTPSHEVHHICCSTTSISENMQDKGSIPLALLFIAYGIFTLCYENTSYGFGLWLPSDSIFFRYRISPIGILHILTTAVAFSMHITAFAGACLLATGTVYCYAAYREESGDGGRKQRAKDREAALARAKKALTSTGNAVPHHIWKDTILPKITYIISWNPITFYLRIFQEDKVSSYFWVLIFLMSNLILFAFTLNTWLGAVNGMKQQLLDGTADIYCHTRLCHANRKAVRYGPFSTYAAYAKGFGNCLNMNCALILLPVIKILLRKLNDAGVSFSRTQHSSDYFRKFFAHPLTRYLPIQKNIEFHILCATTVFLMTLAHVFCHVMNVITAAEVTLEFFRMFKSGVSGFLTGAIVTFAMFMIYTAAPAAVRRASYEIFTQGHVWGTVFFLFMFVHGPSFIYWSCIPVALYIIERCYQYTRGNKHFLIAKVEWISPVMAIYFHPRSKEDFVFKEGQYLFLNCPAISLTEWHPFTISSSPDDLVNNRSRILLETGEEVVEVPRPSNLPPRTKWNKYCLASQDWRNVNSVDYFDKSETGYNDFVSVHVKVHGLEDVRATTWTRKLKEYFELISQSGKFPFYFSERDSRGDITVGKHLGPSNQPILRVDGPHSAPAEHYANYGTVMLIGAGIGLTPCASILTSLTKYRWKKNFNPEILHFYWIVRQNELDSFQWLVHMLTDLSFEVKRSKERNQIEKRYYCEINIYVTAVEKTALDVKPLYRPEKKAQNYFSEPLFTADELYGKLLNPTVESKGQIKKMRAPNPANRLQDIWIWNGRPHWDEIFQEMKEQRQHSDIGVCFCGAPVIGKDLKSMCEKYTSVPDNVVFSLHKENF